MFRNVSQNKSLKYDMNLCKVNNVVVMQCQDYPINPRVTTGKDEDKPEFSDAEWFSMLFACGIGIGLFFFRYLNQNRDIFQVLE